MHGYGFSESYVGMSGIGAGTASLSLLGTGNGMFGTPDHDHIGGMIMNV